MLNLYHSRLKNQGRSLVELMIAITISMVIMIALVSLYVTNKQTFRATDDKARLDEDGRFALNLIAFHLRMAGYGALQTAKPVDPANYPLNNFYRPAGYDPASPLQAVQGCSGGFGNPATVAHTCNNTTAADAIIIRYFVDADNANQSSTNVPTDCLGQGVTLLPAVVENRFYIATSATSSLPELYCVGNGGSASNAVTFAAAPQPIAENITDMRVTYGIDTDGDQTADTFQPASSVAAANWSNVVSAQICLVIRSANNGVTTSAQQYRDCSGAVVTAADRRLYAVFSTVVTVRSRASGSTL